METKNLSRMTIDLPEETHKKLKALAAIEGKSMREVVMESINKRISAVSSITEEEKLKHVVEEALKKYAPLLKKLAES